MLERLERFEAVVNDYADSRAGSDDEQLAEAALSRQRQRLTASSNRLTLV